MEIKDKIAKFISLILEELEMCSDDQRQVKLVIGEVLRDCGLNWYQLENILNKLKTEGLIINFRSIGEYE